MVGYVSWQRSRLQFSCIIKDTIKHSNLIAHNIQGIFRANRAAYNAPLILRSQRFLWPYRLHKCVHSVCIDWVSNNYIAAQNALEPLNIQRYLLGGNVKLYIFIVHIETNHFHIFCVGNSFSSSDANSITEAPKAPAKVKWNWEDPIRPI